MGDSARSVGPGCRTVIALIPDPNVAGTNIYASTPVTETRQDQFDVRIDHQFAPTVTTFARYSFVDTDTFRPSPLPDLAEGSFNDAFGSNLNRSQGLAIGATWIASADAHRRIPFRLVPRQLLHESAERRHRRRRPVRHSQRPQRSGHRRRPAEDEHPGIRRRRATHLDAAVPDAAIVEPARELHDEPQRAHAEVRVRVPARPDARSTTSTPPSGA